MKHRLLAFAAVVVLSGCGQGAYEDAAEEDTVVEDVAPGATEWCELTGDDEPVGECARFQRQVDALDAGVDAFQPAKTMIADEVNVVTYAITRLPDRVQGEGGEIADPVPDDTAGTADDTGAQAEETASPDPLTTAPTGPTQEEIDAALAEAREAVVDVVADAGEEDTVRVEQVKMSRFMYACLKGPPSFVVAPAECQSLDTLAEPQAVWHWQVTPTEPGKDFELRLISGFEVRASDGSTRRIGNPVRSAQIEVNVTPLGRVKRFVADAEEWIRTPLGLIAALTALLLAVAGLRRAFRSARGQPSEPGDAPPPGDGAGG